jgi:hypothetical protein
MEGQKDMARFRTGVSTLDNRAITRGGRNDERDCLKGGIVEIKLTELSSCAG